MTTIELTEPDLSATAPEHAAVFAAGWRAGQRHLVESLPETEWKPIASAPRKDNESFLVSNGSVIRVAFFIGGFLYIATGFHMSKRFPTSFIGEAPEMPPDRWMPLPPPPRGSGRQETAPPAAG